MATNNVLGARSEMRAKTALFIRVVGGRLPLLVQGREKRLHSITRTEKTDGAREKSFRVMYYSV